MVVVVVEVVVSCIRIAKLAGTGLAPGQPGLGPDDPVWRPVGRLLDRVTRSGSRSAGFWAGWRFSLLFFPKPKPKDQIEGK